MRFKIPAVFAASIAILLFSQTVIHAAPAPQTLIYTVQLSSPIGNMGTRTLKKKGDNFVWEVNAGQVKTKLVKNGDGVFLFNPVAPTIGKYPPNSGRENPEFLMPGPAGDVKQFLQARRASLKRTEKAGKITYSLYSYIDKRSGRTCTLYVDKANMKPAKLIMTGKVKAELVTAVYKAYTPGAPVSDAIFKLPKDAKIQPMPDPKKLAKKAAGVGKKTGQ